MQKTQKTSFILAIDTSCDDTAAAVTEGWRVHSNVIASQTELHAPYGGVFPTVAKQAHKETIAPVVATALKRASVPWEQIAAIAVTQGPGLAPALEVGIEYAKKMAASHNLPLIASNHIEAHALSPLLVPKTKTKTKATVRTASQSAQIIPETSLFPALSLVISGGHSEFIVIQKPGVYLRLGWKLDDAAGECLDKVGRLLGLGYPAGPVLEEFAKKGDPAAYDFPLPMATSDDYNLSFSGLKTHARRTLSQIEQEQQAPLTKQQTYDFAAAIQLAVFRHIQHKFEKILSDFAAQKSQSQRTEASAGSSNTTGHAPKTQLKAVLLGGGVAANTTLKKMLRQSIHKTHRLPLLVPYTKKLCMDNAAMIGGAAYYKLKAREFTRAEDLERLPRLRLS